ncbi:MAG: hypothetical protein WB630_16980 [Candidatus Acidiferrales bacterium]
MKDPKSIDKCEVPLPVAVWGLGEANTNGVTKYVSARGICFSVDGRVAGGIGTALMLFVCLPQELTAGNQALIRARARVTGIRRSKVRTDRLTITARMESYDFIAKTL